MFPKPHLFFFNCQPFHLALAYRLQEFSSFLQVKTLAEMVVDQSSAQELLRINFNIRYVRWSEYCNWHKFTQNVLTHEVVYTAATARIDRSLQQNGGKLYLWT